MLENLINDTDCDLIKIFTYPSDVTILDDIINVNDWENKAGSKKLDQDVQQNYKKLPVSWLAWTMQTCIFKWSVIMRLEIP